MEDNSTETNRLPKHAAGIERQAYGGKTVVTANGIDHLLLGVDEIAVLDDLDGTTRIEDLTAVHGADAPDLIADFAAHGLLESSPPPDVREGLSISRLGIEFSGFDRVVATLHCLGGHFLMTRRAAALMVAITIVGTGILLTTPTPHVELEPIPALTILVLSGYLAAFIHETAHALVLHHHGRRIGRAGFGFYWGAVAYFVDSSDALMLPKRTRVTQALAGPFSDAVLGGALAIAAALSPSPVAATLLLHLAVLQWLVVLDNLVPLLELDGYWVLADILDEPDLHARAMSAARCLFHGITAAPLLAIYGLTSLAFGVGLTGFGLWIWVTRFGPLVVDAAQSGLLGIAVAALFAGPLAAGLISGAIHIVSTITTSRREVTSDEDQANRANQQGPPEPIAT